MEDCLIAVQHRLEFYQRSGFACDENAEAMSHIAQALDILNLRTARRMTQGVEGTHAAHVAADIIQELGKPGDQGFATRPSFLQSGGIPGMATQPPPVQQGPDLKPGETATLYGDGDAASPLRIAATRPTLIERDESQRKPYEYDQPKPKWKEWDVGIANARQRGDHQVAQRLAAHRIRIMSEAYGRQILSDPDAAPDDGADYISRRDPTLDNCVDCGYQPEGATPGEQVSDMAAHNWAYHGPPPVAHSSERLEEADA